MGQRLENHWEVQTTVDWWRILSDQHWDPRTEALKDPLSMGQRLENHWEVQKTVELWRVLSGHYSDALNESAKAYP